MPPIHGPLPPVTLTNRGTIKSIRGKAYVAGLRPSVAVQMRTSATSKLIAAGIDKQLILIEDVRESERDAVGSGSGIVLWAETEEGCIIGGSAIGAKSKSPTSVANDAVKELMSNLEHGGCVDEYLQVSRMSRLCQCRAAFLMTFLGSSHNFPSACPRQVYNTNGPVDITH